MISFVARGWLEVEKSISLKIYGLALALVHTVTAVHWWANDFASVLSPSHLPICQPFFQSCYHYRFLSQNIWNAVLIVYFLASLLGASFFLLSLKQSAKVALALPFLLFLNLFKFVLYAQDYSFMGNYHYMPFVVSAVYLFLPSKRYLLPVLLCCLYVAAGLLKFNIEWLSGAAIQSKDLWLTGLLLRVACALVLLLETVLIWGLLSQDRFVRSVTLAILIIFHTFSWQIVGFFYPVIMFLLLSLFPLLWWRGRSSEASFQLRSKVPERQTRRQTQVLMLAMVAVFFALQSLSWFRAGDSALTGEGRFFSLNMFDARAQCQATFIAKHHLRASREYNPDLSHLGNRIRCDPYVYYQVALQICRQLADDPDFVDLDWRLQNKRTTDEEYQTRVQIDGFCQSKIGYSLLESNQWIIK